MKQQLHKKAAVVGGDSNSAVVQQTVNDTNEKRVSNKVNLFSGERCFFAKLDIHIYCICGESRKSIL